MLLCCCVDVLLLLLLLLLLILPFTFLFRYVLCELTFTKFQAFILKEDGCSHWVTFQFSPRCSSVPFTDQTVACSTSWPSTE